ncbi:MAG: SIR2 family protein [Rhodocyclaceae bacterium]|nr:SIR2 family protein [Rhodocyclaceae bacterium]
MIPSSLAAEWMAGLADGTLVPYLGPGILADVRSLADGRPMPADSDSLILAMNDGRPMPPKLMYEFPRAAMNVELKRGRATVSRFLTRTYGETDWSRAAVHDWLARIRPPYVIDINRDTQLQESFAGTPHTLVVGIARTGGTEYRFRLFARDQGGYRPVGLNEVDVLQPVLFKPMGTPRPEPSYIASDADYVDYITELMGGFAVPPFVKERRLGKRYLFLGMRFSRDTERMVMTDLVYAHGEPAGWALIPEPTEKERRFCARMGIRIVAADLAELVGGEALVAA